MKGSFIIITGPSASGKTTLVAALLQTLHGAAKLPTVTTRAVRPGECDGVDYFFTDSDSFKKRIAAGEFFEYAEVYGNLYGSSKAVLSEFLENHKFVISVVDVKGAKTLKEKIPEAFVIFLRPASENDVVRRLKEERKEIPASELSARLKAVEWELGMASSFDAIVENKEGELAATVSEVLGLIQARK